MYFKIKSRKIETIILCLMLFSFCAPQVRAKSISDLHDVNHFSEGEKIEFFQNYSKSDALWKALGEVPLQTVVASQKLKSSYRFWLRPDVGEQSVCIRVNISDKNTATVIAKKSERIEKEWRKGKPEMSPADFLLTSKQIELKQIEWDSAKVEEFQKLLQAERFWSADAKSNSILFRRTMICGSYLWYLEGATKKNYKVFFVDGATGGPVRVIGVFLMDSLKFKPSGNRLTI